MSPPDENPHLTLILPVRHGADWIENNLRTVLARLDAFRPDFEVITVHDGDEDRAWRAALRIAAEDPRVRVYHYPMNQGKGFALSFGVAQARGRLVGWLDSDLDIDPEAIVRACAEFDGAEIDAAVGSKRHPEAEVEYHPVRRLYSVAYQLLVRVLFRLNVRDTQVGAKVFRSEVLELVTPLLLVKRYAFDLEVLAVGALFGFDRVVEVPVSLDHGFGSSSIDLGEVWYMLLDTLAIGYRIHIRHWYARRFAALQRARASEDQL